MKEKIQAIIKELHGDSFKRGKDWKGFKVFVPVYKKPTYIGFPLVVLAKDEKVRVSTIEESLEYLEYSLNALGQESEV